MTDLISRADAIGALQQFAEDEKPTDEMSKQFQLYQRGRHLAFLQAVDEIKALPSADAVQGWIPCSERLPNEKQEVYVTVYFTEGDTGRAYGCIDGFGKWHLYSIVEGTLNSGYEVIAWMPLPTPYKGGEDK